MTTFGIKHSVAWLRQLSKFTCIATFFLIFVGGLVTSTGSGLAVPDWPLSYGTLFPPMVGGIFYEHGHRMVAAGVGFLTLCLVLGLGIFEKRRWVRNLGFAALAAVILQGILGGITVLLFLPTPVSVAHGILAQTFFVLTIILAYSLSKEYHIRQTDPVPPYNRKFLRLTLLLIVLIYAQLTIGAVMRHTQSGWAIPDFPTKEGIGILFLHGIGALILLTTTVYLNMIGWRFLRGRKRMIESLLLLDGVLVLQLLLGITTVLTAKEPHLTSWHVAVGAGILGLTVLLFLRAAPLRDIGGYTVRRRLPVG